MAAILDLELDLPLAETPASRFLAWIAGALVFLAVLALALASAAGGTVRRLALEPRIVTVALPAPAPARIPPTPRPPVSWPTWSGSRAWPTCAWCRRTRSAAWSSRG